ncbi:hypothetical protein CesoFtcFv8_023964 [Champsocephalus esox]|uniref:Uncharacterized protein n=2 Tax=Champsocephalus TaxID=52236 RepID=A0AAN8CAG9_CHAGU|nr:hypothetical protein CesoFtcFv8_023964 [Champsocephalus esox]KAK5900526.1 hypothetical protein CgunFtcFv8_025482 [Champsocephalus gunnari]
MKSWNMRVTRVLQLSVLLVGLCQAQRAPPPSTSEEAGGVPVSQLKMLALGLAHLLQGVEENARQLEQRGEQAEAELDGATRNLESLRKQSQKAGRNHRQVRKDLQILSARGDRLWKAARDLQKVLEDVETEQGAMQQRINRVLQRIKSLTEPKSRGKTQLDMGSVKVVMDKQARKLASLNSKCSARDRMIDRRRRHIDHLEIQISESLPAALRADSLSDCV